MSHGQGTPTARESPGSQADGGLRILLALAAFALAAVAIVSAPALAADSTPPAFGNTSVVNDTTFEVTIEDDAGVDESTISSTDFSLSTGSIDSFAVNESGNNSVARFVLADKTRSQNLTVNLVGSIADDAGNSVTDGSVTVTGVDGYAPFLKEYEVTWLDESTVRIEYFVDEPLDTASVGVHGRESGLLNLGDFTETDTPPANEFRYAANYTFETEGEYRVTLESVADASGNAGLYFADRTVVYDGTDPEARISGPSTASVGQQVTFDGGQSSDEHGVSSYRWAVDGNVTGTDETFSYNFTEAGRHEVELTVDDGHNNTAVARHPLEVLDATTTVDVTITPTNGSGVDVVVGPNRSKQRVLVERSGSLASNGSAILDSVTLTVPTNATANLSTAASPGVPSAFGEGNRTGFGTFTLDHEGASVSDVTFRFSVNRTAIENASVPLDGVSLYRESDGWTRLPTLRVGGNDSYVQYRATSPGLSRFAIAGSDEPVVDSTAEGSRDGTDGTDGGESADSSVNGSTGEPAFSVVGATLLTHNVSAGDPVVAQATVANDGNASGTYVAGLSINGTVVETSDVTVPAGEQREVTVAAPIDAGGPASLNGTDLGTVAVGGGAVGTSSGQGDGSGGGLSVPNPLSLWPGGLFGRALGALFWLVVVVYAILKSLAIYLGY